MTRIHNLLFGAAMLATLGFGVASAAAQVGEPKQEMVCPFLRTYEECVSCCQGEGMTNAQWVNHSCTCS